MTVRDAGNPSGESVALPVFVESCIFRGNIRQDRPPKFEYIDGSQLLVEDLSVR
jgi:hypothetical protein